MCVSVLTRDIHVAILTIRPSVRLSVCNVPVWMKTAQHIVIVFTPYGSAIILVLSASNIFMKFRWGHPPAEVLNTGGV